MTFLIAKSKHFDDVKRIVHRTIDETFHEYYSDSAVSFFQQQHNDEAIRLAISSGHVYLIRTNGMSIATASVRGNEIYRLFVLPEHQHQGYCSKILDFLEKTILREYDTVHLDSCAPALKIALYESRGYQPIEHHRILTLDGEIIEYDVMELKK
ncbi:MAG: GNAT family N-acetyltransferase [Butyricicoccaceae bacterium]